LLLFVCFFNISAQDIARELLRGQVLYRGNNVVNENVINSTTGMATITNDDGRFAISVKVGDQLVFTAVNYQLEIIDVTQQMIDNKRLVVEVAEKVTELDEVVVSPENQKKFLEVKNEDFKDFEYEIDRSSEVVDAFLLYCDKKMGSQDLLKKENEFELIDFLVTHSKTFLTALNEE